MVFIIKVKKNRLKIDFFYDIIIMQEKLSSDKYEKDIWRIKYIL